MGRPAPMRGWKRLGVLMKLKACFLISCWVLMASLALADGVPPDPVAGVGGGGDSQEIFSTNFPFVLTNCVAHPNDSECLAAIAAFGSEPQAVFAGDNDTGSP